MAGRQCPLKPGTQPRLQLQPGSNPIPPAAVPPDRRACQG